MWFLFAVFLGIVIFLGGYFMVVLKIWLSFSLSVDLWFIMYAS